jgi:hypothetical protein
MFKMAVEWDFIGVGGIVITLILLAADKAEKLKGPIIYWLLGIAALMTVPLVLRFVAKAPDRWKYWAFGTGIAIWLIVYSALAVWFLSTKLAVGGASDMVARVYARGVLPQSPATSSEYKPYLQEFFYDWVLTLAANGQTGEITVIIDDPIEHKDDKPKVEPDPLSVSDLKPKWLSGFDEPSRKPDFYERTVTFSDLDKDRPARVILRRPIRFPAQFGPQEFSRSFRVIANKCRIKVQPSIGDAQHLQQLTKQLQTLANWRYSGLSNPSLPIRENPDAPLTPLAPFEVETTLEVRCEDASCKKMLMHQLEARKGAL